MLPHLADRPLNLQRFPNGSGAPGFWQKDIPSSAPRWLTIWHETGFREREDRAPNDHLVADRAATLCWLGNQAAFEIHAWTSVLARPLDAHLRPDRHRPRHRARPGPRPSRWRASSAPPWSTWVCAPTRSSPAAAASRPGSPSNAAATPTRRRARGSRSSRGRSGRPCRTSSPGSGPRPNAGGGRASTTRRTRRSRRWSPPTPSARDPVRPCPRRSAGRSWTRPTWHRIAGPSATSGNGSRPPATRGQGCRTTPGPAAAVGGPLARACPHRAADAVGAPRGHRRSTRGHRRSPVCGGHGRTRGLGARIPVPTGRSIARGCRTPGSVPAAPPQRLAARRCYRCAGRREECEAPVPDADVPAGAGAGLNQRTRRTG